MSFAAWSPATVLAGALAIAALLFVLQRLRVHRRVVRLASAPLWAQAAREAPPRVLGGRFRRPLAYLLALAIALTLWLAASRPERDAAADGRFHLFYLDASALMTGGDAFARARAALMAQVAAVPARERAVYLGDAYGSRLLAAGEDAALLPGRLAGEGAAARPPQFAQWLARVPSGEARGAATVHYFGHRAVYAAAGRPGGTTHLVAGYLAAPVAADRGIAGLGVAPAASGAWGRADVFVALWAGGGAAPALDAARLSLDGAGFVPARVDALGGGRYLLRDVPAEGRTFAATLRRGDGFAANDRAAIVIPDRRPVRVAIGAGVPATVARAIRLDPAFRVVATGAQVAVRVAGVAADGDVPALILSDPATEAATFVVATGDAAGGAALADRLGDLGLSQIDAAGLADELGRPVAVRAGGGRRSVAAWRTLFDDRSGFARSAALPLFVSQSLRWLARPAPWVPYAQAGDTLPDRAAADGPSDDPALDARRMNGAIYLPEAGATRIAGREVAVALDGAAIGRMATDAGTGAGPDAPSRGYPDLPLAALLLAAAALLALEWRLVQRGWMP